MSNRKNYNEQDVLNRISKKHDIQIVGRQIQELTGKKAKSDVGIGTKGKIDFLTKYCHYVHFYV